MRGAAGAIAWFANTSTIREVIFFTPNAIEVTGDEPAVSK